MKAWSGILRSGEGRVGGILLLIFALLALSAPLLFPGDPLAITATPLLAPFTDSAHLLGADRLGRDIAAELAWGARTTLLVALASALTSLLLGSVIGTLAGSPAPRSAPCANAISWLPRASPACTRSPSLSARSCPMRSRR
jgi:ABC-type dipeptide/oligopeptide/nickel transport system permease subunit